VVGFTESELEERIELFASEARSEMIHELYFSLANPFEIISPETRASGHCLPHENT
jgi:hypothetical protein